MITLQLEDITVFQINYTAQKSLSTKTTSLSSSKVFTSTNENQVILKGSHCFFFDKVLKHEDHLFPTLARDP